MMIQLLINLRSTALVSARPFRSFRVFESSTRRPRVWPGKSRSTACLRRNVRRGFPKAIRRPRTIRGRLPTSSRPLQRPNSQLSLLSTYLQRPADAVTNESRVILTNGLHRAIAPRSLRGTTTGRNRPPTTCVRQSVGFVQHGMIENAGGSLVARKLCMSLKGARVSDPQQYRAQISRCENLRCVARASPLRVIDPRSGRAAHSTRTF
jgi:hypothetical protein